MVCLVECCSKVEDFLTGVAAIPVLGSSIAGPIKTCMGITQIVGGVAVGCVVIGPSCCSSRWVWVRQYAREQVTHGLNNVYTGGLESVPFFACFHLFLRDIEAWGSDFRFPRVETGYEHKYYPYSALVERDIRFFFPTKNSERVELAMKTFRDKVEEEKIRNPIPSTGTIERIAEETLNQVAKESLV